MKAKIMTYHRESFNIGKKEKVESLVRMHIVGRMDEWET